jgi:hypothetical protein
MPVVIMIVVVPIVLVVPPVFMFVPPSVTVFPAPLSRFSQFVAPVIRLLALVAVLFNGAVQFVICVDEFFLAIIVRFRSRRRCHQRTRHNDCCSARKTHQAGFPS